LYVYYVAVSSTEERIYAVEPHVCLLIPWWATGIIIFVCIVLIGCFILAIVKCCIMFLDYRKFKRLQIIQEDNLPPEVTDNMAYGVVTYDHIYY